MSLSNEESVSLLDQYLADIDAEQKKSRKRKTFIIGCLTLSTLLISSYLFLHYYASFQQFTSNFFPSDTLDDKRPILVKNNSYEAMSPGVSFDSFSLKTSFPPASYTAQDNTSFISQSEYSSTSTYNLPTYPGGKIALSKFLTENINYPQEAKSKNVEGKVHVAFTVKEDGAVENPRIMHSLSPECDKEAIRVLENMPNWIPAIQTGKKVIKDVELVIEFKIL